jgi:hypothetical protein
MIPRVIGSGPGPDSIERHHVVVQIPVDRLDGMRILRLRHLTGALLFALVAVAPRATAQARWTTLDEFLTRGIQLSAQETAGLDRGETIARVLPTGDGRDVAVFGAVQINVSRGFFADRQRDVMRALKTATRTKVQRFSDPAVASDARLIEISNDDLKELRNCRPNDCNFKLPATDMQSFRAAMSSGRDAKSLVASYAVARMVEFVNDYRARGNAAMLVFDDRGTVRSSDALIGLLRDSSYVFSAVPSLGQYLVDYPRSTLPGAADVIFWSRDEMPHLRPVLRITHQTIYSPAERNDVTVIALKQIYANHYFEAGLEALAAVDRGAPGSAPNGITVVAIRRYRFDHLPSGGLLNIRGRVTNGLRDNVAADLKRLKRDTESDWTTRGAAR